MPKKDTYDPVVVVIGYNRPEAFRNLLHSLNRAVYPHDNIQLILSLEFGATDSVIQIAHSFEFNSGEKMVKQVESHLGVKEHVLQSGDLSLEFGSVIILEEDLTVSPDFYLFAKQALSFYSDEIIVAGISLYSQHFNETAQLPFEPMPSSRDTYFMQLACSWGQAWDSKQWGEFKSWHEGYDKDDDYFQKLPKNIQRWPEDSWKKIFNLYMVQNNKYFVYPYKSFTTNNSGYGGRNMKVSGNLFQVPIGIDTFIPESYRFLSFSDDALKYDSYMENSGSEISKYLGLSGSELELDLYGTKPAQLFENKKYVITSRKGPKPMRTFSLRLKPMELNLTIDKQKNREDFFRMYDAGRVMDLKDPGTKEYAKMTGYFSYFIPTTKKYMSGYLRLVAEKLMAVLKP